jgi:hypothetical protein
MKFCVGMMFQNEAEWLTLGLSYMMRAKGIGLVGLDGGSVDGGADVIREFGGICYENPYCWPDLGQHNKLIECCEDAGYDGMIKVDPDETFFVEHLEQMAELLENFKALSFPTYNFVNDRLHYAPMGWYPDWHVRAWRLNIGIRYINDFHNVPNWEQIGLTRKDMWAEGERDVIDCPHIHLYHYGEIKDIRARALRSVNIARFQKGEPLLEGLPDDFHPRRPFSIPFIGAQPLDPMVVGARAPVETSPPTPLQDGEGRKERTLA